MNEGASGLADIGVSSGLIQSGPAAKSTCGSSRQVVETCRQDKHGISCTVIPNDYFTAKYRRPGPRLSITPVSLDVTRCAASTSRQVLGDNLIG